jgi:hypothetical protein
VKCPLCRSTDFYVKDPQDSFTTYPFSLAGDGPQFSADSLEDEPPPLEEHTETYCARCAWHGRLAALRP